KRPLPVTLLSLLVMIIMLRAFHRGPAPKSTGPSQNTSRNAAEEAGRFAQAESQQAQRQAANVQEEILKELRKEGLMGNPPQPGQVTPGEHSTPALPGLSPEAPAATSQTPPKIILVPLAPRPWEGELKQG